MSRDTSDVSLGTYVLNSHTPFSATEKWGSPGGRAPFLCRGCCDSNPWVGLRRRFRRVTQSRDGRAVGTNPPFSANLCHPLPEEIAKRSSRREPDRDIVAPFEARCTRTSGSGTRHPLAPQGAEHAIHSHLRGRNTPSTRTSGGGGQSSRKSRTTFANIPGSTWSATCWCPASVTT